MSSASASSGAPASSASASADDAELREAFDLFCRLGGCAPGRADAAAVKAALRALGYDAAAADVAATMRAADATGGGTLSFSQFAAAAAARPRDGRAEVARVFALFASEAGRFRAADVSRVAAALGEPLDAGEVQAIVDAADRDGDGAVDLDDFCRVMAGRRADDSE